MKNIRVFAFALYCCGFALTAVFAQQPATTPQPPAPTTITTPTYMDFQAAKTAAQAFAQAKDYDRTYANVRRFG